MVKANKDIFLVLKYISTNTSQIKNKSVDVLDKVKELVLDFNVKHLNWLNSVVDFYPKAKRQLS